MRDVCVQNFQATTSETTDILEVDLVSESSGIVDISGHVGYELVVC